MDSKAGSFAIVTNNAVKFLERWGSFGADHVIDWRGQMVGDFEIDPAGDFLALHWFGSTQTDIVWFGTITPHNYGKTGTTLFGYDWTGQSYQEILSGNQATMLMVLSILVVFLCLAALYESWSIPVSVLLVVPLGILGAVVFTMLRGLSNDIFFKIGLVTVIGLAAKNAILIVEFAVLERAAGRTLREATIEAARLRLRPILMTSLAFIMGVTPMALSTGAGANARHAIGTGVIGGMLFATFLGLLLIPVFFVAVRRMLGDPMDEPAPGRQVGHAPPDAH